MSELVIRGGTVIDGTGAPGVRADVAIDAGTITEIGVSLKGDRELDATGHIVAPGFIDIHKATDFLGTWVRDRQLMTLEQAVRRLTGVQAELLGLSDRGHLTAGAWADVVVFDPATVAPGPIRRLADFPADSERLTADQPVGVRHVLVNGVPIRTDGKQDLTIRSGQLVRSAPRKDV
jgi:N-acyl-D-aspartate/D-glutamate deacylase